MDSGEVFDPAIDRLNHAHVAQKELKKTVAPGGPAATQKKGRTKVGPERYRVLALMWIEAVYLQVERLETAVDEMNELQLAQGWIDRWKASDKPKEWASAVRKAKRRIGRQRPLTLGQDKYFFLLALAQLIKCVEALPDDGLPEFADQKLLKDLRNIEEHWDEKSGPSIDRVRLAIPDVEPGRIAFNNKHIWIEGIDLLEMLTWTFQVHRRLRANAIERGEEVFDLPWHQGPPSSPRATRMVMTALT